MSWSDQFKFRDCPWCGLHDSEMRIITTNVVVNGQPGTQRIWSVVGCSRCAGIILLETNGASNADRLISTYPQDVNEGRTVKYLPEEVEKHYLKAIRALDAGLPDAAAVQLRKTLEAAASKHDSLKGSLAASIKELIGKGLITGEFSKVLDRVRIVGNLGAHHTDEEIDQETAEQVLRFTTQVLRNLFEIPGELEELEEESNEDEDSVTPAE